MMMSTAETVWFTEPHYENGRIGLGPRLDGEGEMFYRLYGDDSMWGGFILSGVGSGSTSMIQQIAVTALSARNTILFYIDGQDGASDPLLFKYADWAVGRSGALRMLAALELAAWRRVRQNVEHRLAGFTPDTGRPGILVIVDALHAITRLVAGDRLTDVVLKGRKLGLSVLATDEDASLATFNGDDRLRAALCAGNEFAMFTHSQIAARFLPGIDINPAHLSRIPGRAVGKAPDEDGVWRNVEFQNRYIPTRRWKLVEHAESYVPPSVPILADWLEQFPQPALDEGTANAMGAPYLYRNLQVA
jgi:hypothetical protein